MPPITQPKSAIVGQLLQKYATHSCSCLRPLQRVSPFTTSPAFLHRLYGKHRNKKDNTAPPQPTLSARPLQQFSFSKRPLRQQLKHLKRKEKKLKKYGPTGKRPRLREYELTVGIEVHAELNTAHKLFSRARTSVNADPNSHVALFDAAFPGAQPEFQKATLIPAIRAALAFDCEIQPKCSWDRKHYFYQDQPNGYQITQYYEPFARDGYLTLTLDDGIDPRDVGIEPGSDGTTHPSQLKFPNGKPPPTLKIGIKQIQMEQDTAKSSLRAPSTHMLDFNRVSHPLIEIITLPQIHSPKTAAATVRKIQSLLRSVDACVAGMEMGGLRADVNVSVRRKDSTTDNNEYAGVKGLGTRTEIKNLSSFKAIELAVRAERNRQLGVLEIGGTIESETRGWTIGETQTVKLRSKEGEVDYRYMPDPDLKPVFISKELVDHLKTNLPRLPKDTLERVIEEFGVTMKDAKTLLASDDGQRLDYCAETVDRLLLRLTNTKTDVSMDKAEIGKLVGNWVLHEIGGLLKSDGRSWERLPIGSEDLAAILTHLLCNNISGKVAKKLLKELYHEEPAIRRSVDVRIVQDRLMFRAMSHEDLVALATSILDENPTTVNAIKVIKEGKKKNLEGKTMWLVGQIMRKAPANSVEAPKAKKVVEELLEKRMSS